MPRVLMSWCNGQKLRTIHSNQVSLLQDSTVAQSKVLHLLANADSLYEIKDHLSEHSASRLAIACHKSTSIVHCLSVTVKRDYPDGKKDFKGIAQSLAVAKTHWNFNLCLKTSTQILCLGLNTQKAIKIIRYTEYDYDYKGTFCPTGCA